MKYFFTTYGALHPPYLTLTLFVITLKKKVGELKNFPMQGHAYN